MDDSNNQNSTKEETQLDSISDDVQEEGSEEEVSPEPSFVINDGDTSQQSDDLVPDDVKNLELTESAIRVNIAKIERLREEIKPQNEMLNSYLEGDEPYAQLIELAKEASQKKSARKKELLSTENGQQLNNKVNTMKEELKEALDALSHHLREYQRMTGLNEFEGEDGELRQIVYTAKLVRKTNLNRE